MTESADFACAMKWLHLTPNTDIALQQRRIRPQHTDI
jgi:hypothetical protein